jgi:hypothetical protein
MIFIIFGTPRPRSVDYIEMCVKVVDLESADCIDMAERKENWYVFLKVEVKLWVSRDSSNFVTEII